MLLPEILGGLLFPLSPEGGLSQLSAPASRGTEVIVKQRDRVRRQRNPCSDHTIDKLLNLLLKKFF